MQLRGRLCCACAWPCPFLSGSSGRQGLEGGHGGREAVDLSGQLCLRREHARDLRVALADAWTQRGKHTRSPEIHLCTTDPTATQNRSTSSQIRFRRG